MSVIIPTVSAIRDQIVSDITARIGSAVPILPKAFVRVLATALAGVLALLYRYAGWVYRQIFPQTADADALALIGGQFGITRNPAVAARLAATATGTDGTNIPAGTYWTVNGLIYTQDALAVIAAGTATINVTCLTPGAAGNSSGTLSVVSPIAGMASTAAISVPQLQTGVDAEDLETYRARVIQRIANKPQGGSAADYVAWALECAGIVKAFAFNVSAGNVTVYPLIAITGASRIPVAGTISTVQAYLQATQRRPLCATVTAAAMTELTANVTITGLSPAGAATKQLISDALTAYFYSCYPRQYPDEVNPTNILSVAAIWGAIAAAGATATAVALSLGTNYTLGNGEIVTLGTVTWL